MEPEHRLVARSLERDWNEKLGVLDQLERDYAAMAPAAASHVSEAERQGILDLVHDLPAVWQAETTTHAERKQVVRLLIKDVMLTKLGDDDSDRRAVANACVSYAGSASAKTGLCDPSHGA